MLGSLACHAVLVYDREFHNIQEQKALGRAALSLQPIFRNQQRVVIKMLPVPSIASKLLHGSPNAVYVSSQPLYGSPLPAALTNQPMLRAPYFLDREIGKHHQPRMLLCPSDCASQPPSY